MLRIILVSVCSALALLLSAAPASACLNDREVERAEREFRSQYGTPASPEAPAPASDSSEEQVKLYAPLTIGGLLLVGAFVQTARQRDRSK
jgi:hypothetical protein